MSSIRDPRAAVPPEVEGLPLLHAADSDRVVIWRGHQPVRARQYLAEVEAVAARLPPRCQLLNLCEQRDRFLVAFGAGLVRGQSNLLPPSRAPKVLGELATAWPDHHACDDDLVAFAAAHAGPGPDASPRVASGHVAAIGFTSGSTGHPRQHLKTWAAFAAGSRRNAQAITAALGTQGLRGDPALVATVPPQHMYGMELSVLLPLMADFAVHAGRPLLPADIARALSEVPAPRVLVSTPVHLRALLSAELDLPTLGLVVCATAPLDPEVAAAVERRFGAPLLEMFGATETCVIAQRRTALDEAWSLYDDVALHAGPDGTRVEAPWFAEPNTLQDVVEQLPGRRFVLRGRNVDLVEIAGKRASLAELTRRLLALPGVRDAVVLQPEAASGEGVRRLAALVVAPGATAAGLLAQLRDTVDPAFMPRPLLLVDALPRNAVGKLPREALMAAMGRGGA
jgi:acyl-coenzyme A synthetase/AMP-(fatty) acid ligase